tara:strand:- start:377 stop:1450 length:1074 start_codon:yes stop_codon:yes gene_type:complete
MMNNLPEHAFRDIQQALCRPEGTFTFDYTSPDLFDKSKLGGAILEVPTGEHLFRLERDKDCCINFYHSSPGTGTRVATVDLNELLPAPAVFIAFSWTPSEIKLHVRPKTDGAELVSVTGSASQQREFRVGKDGKVYQIGGHGLDFMDVNFYQAGQPILLPTAKNAWEETISAIEVLSTGESNQGYTFEVVVTNLTLAILVTGYEAYSKKRFLELEQEGIIPDTNSIIEAFYPKKEAGIATSLESKAKEKGISLLQYVVSRRVINFQSYEQCKRAYKEAYGIKFGNLDLESDTLKDLKSFISYRHKIVHVSPSIRMLNPEKAPPEKPVFPNKKTGENAKTCFTNFIDALHNATLLLRP